MVGHGAAGAAVGVIGHHEANERQTQNQNRYSAPAPASLKLVLIQCCRVKGGAICTLP